MTGALKYEVTDRVATLTLDRPAARNPLSPEVVAELVAMLHAADADRGVKAMLIRAEGENFSAGGDMRSFEQALERPAAQRYEDFGARLVVANRLPQALVDARKPIVAATRGAVVGAGMSLCLGADFVVSGFSSFFVAAHVRVGLSLDCGLSSMLVACIGMRQAKRLALLGERVDAREALSLGMVTHVVDDAQVDAQAHLLAVRLAEGPAVGMEGSRRLLNAAAYRQVADQLADEARWLATAAATEDFRTGVGNFLLHQHRPFD